MKDVKNWPKWIRGLIIITYYLIVTVLFLGGITMALGAPLLLIGMYLQRKYDFTID